MDGIIYVGGLIALITAVSLRSRGSSTAPGALLTLAIAAGSVWYVFA